MDENLVSLRLVAHHRTIHIVRLKWSYGSHCSMFLMSPIVSPTLTLRPPHELHVFEIDCVVDHMGMSCSMPRMLDMFHLAVSPMSGLLKRPPLPYHTALLIVLIVFPRAIDTSLGLCLIFKSFKKVYQALRQLKLIFSTEILTPEFNPRKHRSGQCKFQNGLVSSIWASLPGRNRSAG